MIGQNVAKYPEITNRIIEEGHIIGNHTYTHPKTYTLEETVLANEIKATQNIVQEVTGVTPRYFRIPFSDLTSLDTEKDLTRYNIAQDQGLISAEYNVDSKDWELNEKQKILDKIFSYDHNESSQVLLHDGGNNRQSTIEALPEIIERLRSQGINLVTVEEADTTNNPVENTKNSLTIFSKLGFLFQNILVSFTSAYFLLFLAFVMARYILLWLLNILSVFTKTAKKYSPIKEKPLVSILIACYNEEQSIQRTIQSVLDSTYKNIEIVVINDGSKDKTLNILQSNFSKNHKVQIISLLNGGKAKAINRGLKIVKGEFVLSIDADTLIYPDTLSNLLSQFNPQTGAVAGNIQVGNDANLLTKNQRLEYILGQNFDKIAFQTINSIMVIPGALGMWRLEAIKQSGGYQTDTLAEDADLTIRLIKNGWKIKYTKNALAITEAPDNISSFIKQRVRWMYGTLQVIFKHKEMLFNKKFGYFGFVVIPEFILTYFFLPIALVSNLILLFLVAKVVTIIFEIDIYFGSFFENSSLAISIILFFVFMFLYSLSVAIAIYREQSKNKWELLLYIPFNILVYRQMLWLINIWVIIKAIKGRKALWNHFEKKGEIKLLTTTKNKPNNLLSKIKKVYKNWSKKYS
ncbi:glycosyltransferase [Candidatus Gracilibacteria bacterium]|nr:glycosyltransferase [Candidatus Gracilibacteria bacterium]